MEKHQLATVCALAEGGAKSLNRGEWLQVITVIENVNAKYIETEGTKAGSPLEGMAERSIANYEANQKKKAKSKK